MKMFLERMDFLQISENTFTCVKIATVLNIVLYNLTTHSAFGIDLHIWATLVPRDLISSIQAVIDLIL